MNELRKIDGMKVIFNEDEIAEITQNIAAVLRSGHLIKGLFTDPFVQAIAKRCGKEKVVLCSSDTAAMEMLFKALSVHRGSVVFQGNMFPSPIFACVRAGGTPLYADLEMDCLGMSPFSLERILERPENNVRAVVVMHTAGIVSPRITDIAEMCNNHGVILIEDCAHAYGSLLWNGGHPQGAGSWGDFAVFSFYATKPMNCGEGGAIAADSRWENVLETVEALSRYGKTELFGAPWCPLPGYSNRMTEILCAIGVVEDKYLNRKVLKRFQVAAVYNNEIRIRGRLYGMFQGQNYYKYVMVPERTMFDRGTFRKVMKDDFGIGIPAGVYDFPVYDQPPLKEMTRSRLPNTDRFCLTHVCLPMHEGLNEEDASYVAKAVNEVLGE